MKQIFLSFGLLLASGIASIVFTSCTTTRGGAGTTYRTTTNFYLLRQGTTKQEFEYWLGLNDGNDYVGKRPAKSYSYKSGDDVWEVWVFEVYKFRQEIQYVPGYGSGSGFDMPVNVPYVDHYEYVAFKNDKIEEWGQGEGRQNYY
jgi:hypothetical protein